MSWCCLICRDKIFPKSQQISVLPCGHNFHSKCTKLWYEHNRSCAICRTSISLKNIKTLYPSTEDYECLGNDTEDIESYVLEQKAEINKKVEELVKLQKKVDDLIKHNAELEIKVSQLDTHIKDLKDSNKIFTGISEAQQTAFETKVLHRKLEAKFQALQKEFASVKFVSQEIKDCIKLESLIKSEREAIFSLTFKDMVEKFITAKNFLFKELDRQEKVNMDLRKQNCLFISEKLTDYEKIKKYKLKCKMYKSKISECSKSAGMKSTSKKVSITEDYSAIDSDIAIQENDCSLKLSFQSVCKNLTTVIIDNLNTPSTSVQSSVITLPNSTSRNLSSSMSHIEYNGLGGCTSDTVINSSKTEKNCKRELNKNDIISKRMKISKN